VQFKVSHLVFHSLENLHLLSGEYFQFEGITPSLI
jgi:hypothetical protein